MNIGPTNGTHPFKCGWEDMCFCGDYACQMTVPSNWTEVAKPLEFSVLPSWAASAPRRALQARALQAGAGQDMAVVRVVFGLTMDSSSELLNEFEPAKGWGFAANFDPTGPWAQRALYYFCEDMPKHLRVRWKFCWMQTFRECLADRGMAFPVFGHSFEEQARLCGAHDSKYWWVREDKLVGMRVSIRLDVPRRSKDGLAQELKSHWMAHISAFNANSVAAVRGAWCAAEFWQASDENAALLVSVRNTMITFLIIAFIVVTSFTWSIALSLIITVATVGVQFGLLFFIVVVMGWSMGMLEGICLIYFVGYAVTYSLHLAHLYSAEVDLQALPAEMQHLDENAAMRFRRTSFALTSIGGATLGSGITTAGASFFLVFCNLTVFERLGGMCLVVTSVSVVVALLPVPACLMMFGPRRPGRCDRFRKPVVATAGKDTENGEEPAATAHAYPSEFDKA
jgi:hypothetical protein